MQETAINVGFACSLLRTDMAQHIVTANTREVCASAAGPFLQHLGMATMIRALF